ncbi:MAG: hypothetical protein J6T40_07645 [Clostridiales bacterium]|nr:hypothetical protein [Clostridiales bacterium]
MKKRFLSFVAGVLCACSILSAAVVPTAAKTADAQLSIAQAAAVTQPGTVTGLKAVSSGKNRVTLTWKAVSGAQGYLVYGQKSGKYAYVGMTTSGTTFTDTKALDNDYNYYWVFAYVKDASGKMIPGGCQKYVFAKGVCAAVTGLKAASTTAGVKLTWNKVNTAAGYLIYGKTDSTAYGYKGMTTSLTWTDAKAPTSEFSYYWVYPYHKDASGNMVVGGTAAYVYGKKTVPVNTKYKVENFSAMIPTLWEVDEDTFAGYPCYRFWAGVGGFGMYCQKTLRQVKASEYGSLIDEYVSRFYSSSSGWTVISRKNGSYSSTLLYTDIQISNDDCIVKGRVIYDVNTWLFYEFLGTVYLDEDATTRATFSKKIDEIVASIKYEG